MLRTYSTRYYTNFNLNTRLRNNIERSYSGIIIFPPPRPPPPAPPPPLLILRPKSSISNLSNTTYILYDVTPSPFCQGKRFVLHVGFSSRTQGTIGKIITGVRNSTLIKTSIKLIPITTHEPRILSRRRTEIRRPAGKTHPAQR